MSADRFVAHLVEFLSNLTTKILTSIARNLCVTGMSDFTSKGVRIAPDGRNSGLFSDEISVNLPWRAKMY